ncbi:tRNA 2-thiouridine(34) synthase TusD [Pseudoalteromonas luteoviolacea]|uniref:tRNA 2-thiouridine(34) synthase TusD n=1 Tax=Pseudoalteromonas luteoviolacea TaxID=43657 RepID=A0A1C0TUG3_9GAMM|nr:sulfurtransferase complex subunit TusD [Pseudoalteromonas luteoviolacea]OCQ22967.1 tRNA 2-thiouridine(34) synthase TusD [Pseudoalteromonas luteoviolacea]
MSQFIISLHCGPDAHDALQCMNRFVQAALKKNHTIKCIFLYQDAVLHANQYIQLSSDELQVSSIWENLSNQGIDLKLCVTAAEKRGINVKNTGVFSVAGLAEFAMEMSQVDRWVQFK